MALEDLARRARLRIDQSRQFDKVISENIVVDYVTGERSIVIVAESTDPTMDVVQMVMPEVEATEATIDKRTNDMAAKLRTRVR